MAEIIENHNIQTGLTQRQIYKVVDRLLAGNFPGEIELLKMLVTDIVERADIRITGGRIWQLQPGEDAYSLQFQYGEIDTIPEDYTISVEEQPIFKKLASQRTVTNYETDSLLLEKGIKIYSATGVGELLKRAGGKFYQYALAFNAPETNQEFYETLNIIGSAVSAALRDLAHQAQEERFQKDLDKASEIQRGLLPDHQLKFQDYDVFGVSLPDSVVGGDYFDYLHPLENEDDRVGVVISDAASKGLPAAIQALFVSGAIRMGITYNMKISSMISRLNTLIYDTFPHERFVSLFYCELMSSENGLVLYSNAGHCSPLFYNSARKTVRELPPTGGLLGIIPHDKFRVENINMQCDDILLLYTDGISEAQSAEQEFFETDRLKNLLKENAHEDAHTIAYAILEEVQKFTVGASYTDDKTIVVIKRCKPKS
ncbi:MAG: PP2C family protein-serine/threonine phosphatase [Bacteroidota bacterium]